MWSLNAEEHARGVVRCGAVCVRVCVWYGVGRHLKDAPVEGPHGVKIFADSRRQFGGQVHVIELLIHRLHLRVVGCRLTVHIGDQQGHIT